MTSPIRKTRKIKVGDDYIGGDAPVLIQTMAATKTQDVDATAKVINQLAKAGAQLIRIAVDTPKDVEALIEIRKRVDANLSVDLQENYRLAERVAPYVEKIRYNPGHLHHIESNLPWQKKVEYLVDVAREYDCAIRVGVNCGSIDPTLLEKAHDAGADDPRYDSILASALEHVDYLESLAFTRYCVSIKSSDPATVVAVNQRFSKLRPLVPIHLGVTEAGAPPRGVIKSRMALEPLLRQGIGDTLRVSLTVDANKKEAEIQAARTILENVEHGQIIDSNYKLPALDIVSCPSCSRVQNGRFVELTRQIAAASEFARDYPIKIAVMGCRVNGPGETDDADIGIWCGVDRANLKLGDQFLGVFPYDQVVEKAMELLRAKIDALKHAQ
ncbi:MAG: flavodoxin/ferredoxin-dependent (E)-4-hydroxy-3-methylbut-2-enyl-diphosphate synthase [Planctomycetia bacterium]|nr:flavodoxin/ferredoxin-dependent (E)-4-hydroxy-3-methylbut-2-enyl-diphosphate synthase [Planctomycetia bacterium]